MSTRKYDVYGAVRGSTGPSGTKHKFVGQLGHPSEDETGLVYMRARHYDAVTGRFASEDPAQDNTNWFAYGSSRLADATDPTGEFTFSQVVLGAALIGGLNGFASGFIGSIGGDLWAGVPPRWAAAFYAAGFQGAIWLLFGLSGGRWQVK